MEADAADGDDDHDHDHGDDGDGDGGVDDEIGGFHQLKKSTRNLALDLDLDLDLCFRLGDYYCIPPSNSNLRKTKFNNSLSHSAYDKPRASLELYI